MLQKYTSPFGGMQQAQRKPFRRKRLSELAAIYNSGSTYYRRKFFTFPAHYKKMWKRIAGRRSANDMTSPHQRYLHLPGDVHRRPVHDFTFQDREDDVLRSWKPRKRLQLHQLQQTVLFVCFHCGYPVRSALVAIKEANWDYRMCYTCYTQVVQNGLSGVI